MDANDFVKTFVFTVSTKKYSYSEFFDAEDASEWLDNYPSDEKTDIHTTGAEIKKLRNKHVIFDLYKSLTENQNHRPHFVFGGFGDIDKRLKISFEEMK